jgi:hypothetical protein
MNLWSKSKTLTTTIYMADIRQVVLWIIKEAGEIKKFYQNQSLFDEVRLARDLGLMFLEDWIVSAEVELYEPDTFRKVYAYSYRATVDPTAAHHEPGTFKKFRKKQGLSYRLVVKINPAKSKEEVDAFFNLINWHYVDPLIESGRGKTERDGGFRSGRGFTVERWVYSDDSDSPNQNTTEEGYRR